MFATGLSLALPVIGALLLVDPMLGVLTRTAPQLNRFAVELPVTLSAGLVMLLLAMPSVAPALEQAITPALSLLLR